MRIPRGNPRRVLYRAVALLALPAFLYSALAQEAAQEVTAGIARAKALISFAYYTDWVAKPAKGPAGPCVIGILGKDAPRFVPPASERLNRPLKSWSRIEFKDVKNLREAQKCQILYVSLEEAKGWPEKMKQLNNPNVLTVSEAEGFLEAGGMVRLKLEQAGLEEVGPKFNIFPEFHPIAKETNTFLIDARVLALERKDHNTTQ